VQHQDLKNDTPYMLAKRNSKHAILKLLLENGANPVENTNVTIKP
jgi:ankyrin repeat protein